MQKCYLINSWRHSDSWPDGVHPGDVDVSTKGEVRCGAEQGCGGGAEVVQHDLGQHQPYHAPIWVGPNSHLLSRDKLALKIIENYSQNP